MGGGNGGAGGIDAGYAAEGEEGGEAEGDAAGAAANVEKVEGGCGRDVGEEEGGGGVDCAAGVVSADVGHNGWDGLGFEGL